MRFFAIFLLFALILAVTARNVPQLTPEQATDFNEQQTQSNKRSLQDAVHNWLNPDTVKRDFAGAFHDWLHQGDSKKLKKRNDVDAGLSAFGIIRDWKTTAEKKFGLVPKN